MNKTEASSPASLETMLGIGEKVIIKGKSYSILPIMGAHIPMFMEDNLNFGSQLFNISDENRRKVLDKWLNEVEVEIEGEKIIGHYCLDENGKPMSLNKTFISRWDIKDYKTFIKKLCDLSD